jgi:spermidine/putrescine transport system permease protein
MGLKFFRDPSKMELRNKLLNFGLMLPALICLIVFIAVPCLSFAVLAFLTKGDYGTVSLPVTFANFKRLVGYNLFGWSPDFLYVILRRLRDAFITTLICIVFSYFLSFYIASIKKPLTRFLCITLLTVPYCTNIVIRTYAWQLFFDPAFYVAKAAAFFGFIEPGEALYPGLFAVYVGMVATFLPFMALPLYTSIERMDWLLPQAAKDLYANKFKVFWLTIFPQTVHGLYAGIIITFVPAMTTFVVTDILGGSKYMLIGNLIQHQFSQARDWPFGAILSLAMLLVTVSCFVIFRILSSLTTAFKTRGEAQLY